MTACAATADDGATDADAGFVERAPAPGEPTPDGTNTTVDDTSGTNTIAENLADASGEDDRRATMALDAMLRRLWDPTLPYFDGSVGDTGHHAKRWVFAQAFDAVLDGVERTHGRRYSRWVRALYDAQRAQGWFNDFFDDENWLALALIHAFDVTHDDRYLRTAEEIFHDIRDNGWDTTCCGDHPGGIWWNRRHGEKATASNAGPVITAVRLYERTHDASALEFAQRVYAYWMAEMVDPVSGAVTDSIHADGQRADPHFTYNEGLVVGASVALYEATGDAADLENARRTAAFMLAHESESTRFGAVLTDGPREACGRGSPCDSFKGIGYRYLVALYEADRSDTALRAALEANARAIWDRARDRSSDLFGYDWTRPQSARVTLGQDASAVMALNLYAALRARSP